MTLISVTLLLGDNALDASVSHTQWLPCPAQPAEGDGPLNSFFGTRIYFSSGNSQLVSRTSRGTVLGDDALFYFMHVSPGTLSTLLPSPTEIHDKFQLLCNRWTPYTSHNCESEQRTLDWAVDTSHTQSHLMSRNSHGVEVTDHL